MKVAISLGMVNPNKWLELTEVADELGYESIWLPEHLVLPIEMAGSPYTGEDHPPVPPDIPIFDAFTYLGFLAGRTSRIRFGTHVYNIGLRHPFITARAVATLDVISGGRVEFGIGASWLGSEWEAVGLDFKTRGKRVDEALEVCRRLWTESVVEYHGDHFDFGPVMFEPKPVQARIPIHVGGDSLVAMRRAAREGGWIPMITDEEALPPLVKRLRELREEAGLDGKVEITFASGAKSPDDLARLEALGVDRTLVRPFRRSADAIDGIKKRAEELQLS